MKPYAETFYNSKAWQATRDAYIQSVGGLCERCSSKYNPVLAKVVHHKEYITQGNIADGDITLNWDNLEALCQDCHNKQQHKAIKKRRYVLNERGEILPAG